MKNVLLLVFAIGLIGCESEPYRPTQLNDTSPQPNNFITTVISAPPGARIEVDNNYVGDAPVDIKWDNQSSDRFSSSHTVKASPLYPSQQAQVKSFSLGDKIPKTIFFDLNRARTHDRYELNNNNN
ncbi:MAG: PEGA domain-containing protein [Sedimentisphaerales bacterium]|nr:PEGA domain-containing protein [Sedimentisphaerales bacterium]